MNSDYVSAVLDEIALEGLDGIAHEGNYVNNCAISNLTCTIQIIVNSYILILKVM